METALGIRHLWGIREGKKTCRYGKEVSSEAGNHAMQAPTGKSGLGGATTLLSNGNFNFRNRGEPVDAGHFAEGYGHSLLEYRYREGFMKNVGKTV